MPASTHRLCFHAIAFPLASVAAPHTSWTVDKSLHPGYATDGCDR